MHIRAILNIETGVLKNILRPMPGQSRVSEIQADGLKDAFVIVEGTENEGVIDIPNKDEIIKNAKMRLLKRDRDAALMSIVSVQGEDRYDARPVDEQNLLAGIEMNQTKWFDADNKVIDTDATVLEAVLTDGKEQAKVIWDSFM